MTHFSWICRIVWIKRWYIVHYFGDYEKYNTSSCFNR